MLVFLDLVSLIWVGGDREGCCFVLTIAPKHCHIFLQTVFFWFKSLLPHRYF